MTSNLAPAGNAALNAAKCLALILLGAWSTSALASRGVSVNYDAAHSDQQDVDAPTATHTIDIIEHEIADASAVPLIPNSDHAADQANGAKVILKSIKERENRPLQSNSDSAPVMLIQIDVHEISPLASPETTPKAEQSKVRNHADSVTTQSPEDSGFETRLPGVSDANDVRFRRQMYRTDI